MVLGIPTMTVRFINYQTREYFSYINFFFKNCKIWKIVKLYKSNLLSSLSIYLYFKIKNYYCYNYNKFKLFLKKFLLSNLKKIEQLELIIIRNILVFSYLSDGCFKNQIKKIIIIIE